MRRGWGRAAGAHLDACHVCAVALKRAQRALEQQLGHEVVEARDDDREARAGRCDHIAVAHGRAARVLVGRGRRRRKRPARPSTSAPLRARAALLLLVLLLRGGRLRAGAAERRCDASCGQWAGALGQSPLTRSTLTDRGG